MSESENGSDDDAEMAPPPRGTPLKKQSDLGLASMHALDAQRVDATGRKALHRFVGGSVSIAPEHLRRVIEVHPEAASHVDEQGWLPLNHYCRGLAGDNVDPDGTDVERHIGMLEERRPAPWAHGQPKGDEEGGDRADDPVFFADASNLADVRKEYKRLVLRYHPDKNIGGETEACRQMARVQAAYAEACKQHHCGSRLETAALSGDMSKVLDALPKKGESTEDVADFLDADSNTLLHLVCKKCVRGMSPEDLKRVIECCGARCLLEQNNNGDTPLNVLCASHRNPVEFDALLKVLLGDETEYDEKQEEEDKEDKEKKEDKEEKDEGGSMEDKEDNRRDAASRPNLEGRMPLHSLCRSQRFVGRAPNAKSLHRLLAAFPGAAEAVDTFDWTVLHLFAQFQMEPALTSVFAVIQANPKAAAARTVVDGDTPIHLACYAQRRTISGGVVGTTADYLRLLAEASPATAIRPCRQGVRPWEHLPKDDDKYAGCCAAIVGVAIEKCDAQVLLNYRDSESGNMLHTACDADGAALTRDHCRRLLEVFAGNKEAVLRRDKKGRTPLARLCGCAAPRTADVEDDEGVPKKEDDSFLLSLLLEEEAAMLEDSRGWLPIHCAAAVACDDDRSLIKLSKLLEAKPECAGSSTTQGSSTPAHLACASCAREIGPSIPAYLRKLALAAPKVVSGLDARGKHAWDYLPRHDPSFDQCFEALLGSLVDNLDNEEKQDEEEVLVDDLLEEVDDEEEDESDEGKKKKKKKKKPKEKKTRRTRDGTLLHVVCAHHGGYVRRVLAARPRDATVANAAGNLALHQLVTYQKLTSSDSADLALVMEVLAANEEAASTPNRAGLYPLHLLLDSQKPAPHPDVFDAILLANESAAEKRCLRGDSPLSILCRSNAKKIGVETASIAAKLIKAAASCPDTMSIEDPCERGLRPWDHLPADDPRFSRVCRVLLHDLLLDPKKQETVLDKSNNTALHLLCSRHGASLRGEWLQSEGVITNEAATAVNDAGMLPLHCLAQFLTDLEAVENEALFAAVLKAEPSAAAKPNVSGWAPIHLFVQVNALEMSHYQGRNALWRCLDQLLQAAPRALGLRNQSEDTAFHLAAHANRKSIGPCAPRLLDALVAAAPEAAVAATRSRGKASRTPIEWLPVADPLFEVCSEILTHRVARCLEVLLEANATAATHILPESGDLALHQICAISPPVATVRMLRALLLHNSEAPTHRRDLDGATPVHLLCLSARDDDRTINRRIPALLSLLLFDTAPEAALTKDHRGFTALAYLPEDDDLYDECCAIFATADAKKHGSTTTPRKKRDDDHSEDHGGANGKANGSANGNGHGNANGNANGNGHANGSSNGSANGKANQPPPPPSREQGGGGSSSSGPPPPAHQNGNANQPPPPPSGEQGGESSSPPPPAPQNGNASQSPPRTSRKGQGGGGESSSRPPSPAPPEETSKEGVTTGEEDAATGAPVEVSEAAAPGLEEKAVEEDESAQDHTPAPCRPEGKVALPAREDEAEAPTKAALPVEEGDRPSAREEDEAAAAATPTKAALGDESPVAREEEEATTPTKAMLPVEEDEAVVATPPLQEANKTTTKKNSKKKGKKKQQQPKRPPIVHEAPRSSSCCLPAVELPVVEPKEEPASSGEIIPDYFSSSSPDDAASSSTNGDDSLDEAKTDTDDGRQPTSPSRKKQQPLDHASLVPAVNNFESADGRFRIVKTLWRLLRFVF